MTTRREGRDVVDTSSRRWVVAEHEAAHAEVARALGHRVDYCWITDGHGETYATPPRSRDPHQALFERAVIALAGPDASSRGRCSSPRAAPPTSGSPRGP